MATENNKQVLNAPNLRFPEFDGEWVKCQLKDICGKLEYGMNVAAKEFDGENKYIRITDIDEASSLYKSDSVVSPDGWLDDKYLVNQNDILFARTGASTGKTYLYNKHDGKLYFAGFLIRANIKAGNNSRFVFYQTQSNRYMNWIRTMSARSGQPGINSQELETYPIFLAPRQEQNKVAEYLSLLDLRIATQSEAITKLQSLMVGLTDKIIEKQLGNNMVDFSSLYSKAGEGGTPTTSIGAYYNEGTIPFIKIDDLSEKYLTKNKDFITELGLKKSSAWIVPKNSIIYSNGATIGAISINTYPVCTKQGILGIVPSENVAVEYLYLLMSSTYFKKEVERIVTEGTMRTAYLKDINNIKCPLPSLQEQQTLYKCASSLSEKISLEKAVLKKLGVQKQYLLQNIFI